MLIVCMRHFCDLNVSRFTVHMIALVITHFSLD